MKITKTPISVHFDNMCWPRLNERYGDLAWKLRYRQASLTQEELYIVVSVMAAFDALVSKTQKERNTICKVLKENV